MVSRSDQIETDPLRALYARLSSLEAEVRELRAGRRAEATSIGAGGLTVKDGGEILMLDEAGKSIIHLGRVLFADGSTAPGLAAFRSDVDGGAVAMSLFGGILAIWDRQGNIVMSTDEYSGQGIARPWLPVTWAGSDYTQWPGTTSGTFSQVCETAVPRQQPRLFVRIRHTTDVSGTTGQLRLMCNGVQLGSTVSVAFSIAYADIGPVALPAGNFSDILGLSVEARRTAGTGAVRAMVTASWSQQS